MGLFDFLFGSDESSTNGLFDKITAVFMKIVATAQAVLVTGHRVKTGTVATMTTMACRDLTRMMIMISNASNQRTQFLISFFSRISPQFQGMSPLRHNNLAYFTHRL